MRKNILGGALLLMSLMAPLASRAQNPLAIGAPAPDFALKDQAATDVRLSDYKGKKTVALVFIVAAFGGSDARQLESYQAAAGAFEAANAQVIAVSLDSLLSNREFALRTNFKLPLVSDWKRTAAEAYGVYKADVGFPERTVFVIDKGGTIRQVIGARESLDPAAALHACKSLMD